MAGLLIIPFSTPKELIGRIEESFNSNRFLEPSHYINAPLLRVVKYKRAWEEKDRSWHREDEVDVLCAGTLLYKDHSLEDTVQAIGKDLRQGSTVEDICDGIDGTFCLVIHDGRTRILHVITDVAGILHTYYYQDGELHVIGTSELAIARTLPVTPALKSIAQFMRAAYILDESTFFEEIRLLEPATHYQFDLERRRVSKRKYHRLSTEIDWSYSFDYSVDKLIEVMGKIIDRFPKETTLVDFTGGNDSRSIMSYIYRLGEEREKISALFTGPPESYEYRLIRNTCSELGIRFYDFLPNKDFESRFYDFFIDAHELGSGEENAAFHAPILWSNENKIKQDFLYSLHGSGGELYRDARWDQEFGRRGSLRPADLKRLIRWRVFQYEYDFSIYNEDFIRWIEEVPDIFYNSYKKTVSSIDPRKGTNTLQLDTIYLMQNMRRWGGATISSTNQIIRSVCPFLFRRPLEVALSVSPNFKKGCRLNKAIAEKIAPTLASKKMQTGSPYMIWKPWRTPLFTPFYSFLAKKLMRKMSQVLFGKTIFSTVTVHDFDPLPRFRAALGRKECKELLDYERMVTSGLYEKERLNHFIESAKRPGFKHYKILGNVMTLELTMRMARLKKTIAFDQ